MNLKPRAAAYVRVACDEHAALKLSGQERAIRQWAAFNCCDVVHVYADIAASGNQEQRPGLQQLIAAAEAGEFEVLLLTHPSRLFRNHTLLQRYLDLLRGQCGIDVLFVDLEGGER
jgi:DNA invertase Pin-like site-specific DNA recombinase